MAERSGERAWIARLAELAGEGSFGLQDDAALLDVSGETGLVVTQDTISAGVHFLSDDPLVAKKAIRVNVSDIVAKGALPFAFLMSLGLPDDWDDARMNSFANDLAEDIEEFCLNMLGGDTTRSGGGLSITITMFGRSVSETPRYVSRLDAKAGDVIAVTGNLGDATLALAAMNGSIAHIADGSISEALETARVLPQPLLGASYLVARHANAAMDVSDGLLADLGKLAVASGVQCRINPQAIPLSLAARALITDEGAEADVRRIAMTGGDDYVVAMTLPRDQLAEAQAMALELGLPGLFPVGETVQEEPASPDQPRIFDMQGNPFTFERLGYEH